jgi:hypothetical protein
MTQRLLTRWFLTSKERGNPSTRLDVRHPGGAPWTEGNMVRPLALLAGREHLRGALSGVLGRGSKRLRRLG